MTSLKFAAESLVRRSLLSKLPTSGTALRQFSAISMDLLKQLRSQSGAPIVECKKALESTNGDLTAAMDWLRQHGAAQASAKVQGRATDQGLVGLDISNNLKTAALVKVASETDFAGRSSTFVDLVLQVARATLADSNLPDGTLSSEQVLAATSDQKSVNDLMQQAIVAIRENLSIASAIKLHVPDDDNGILVGYVHNKIEASPAGTAAAVVQVAPLDGSMDSKTLQAAGKKLAMHVVAAGPQYLSPQDVPSDEVAKEKEVLSKQVEGSGKPPAIVEKIIDGKLKKFYQAVCLTEQAHMIEEDNPQVGKHLKESGIVVKRFETLSIAKK